MRRDPRVSFLVESGERWAELRAVHVTGRARLVTEPELLARVAAALDAKYASVPHRPRGDARCHAGALPVERATIEITPDQRLLSWDNARLRLP